jgi:hypothetical protein
MLTETIWLPAALLPRNGAVWRAIGPNRAEIDFPSVPGVEPINLTLDDDGNVIEILTRRWSDANPHRRYQFQPFGGRILAHRQDDGFTIPAEVEIGNFYGTDDWAPFFRAVVTEVRFAT